MWAIYPPLMQSLPLFQCHWNTNIVLFKSGFAFILEFSVSFYLLDLYLIESAEQFFFMVLVEVNCSNPALCECVRTAIERNLEAEEAERVSADMRIRKSQVSQHPARITHTNTHALLTLLSCCTASTLFFPGSLLMWWPNTMKLRWTSERKAKVAFRDN